LKDRRRTLAEPLGQAMPKTQSSTARCLTILRMLEEEGVCTLDRLAFELGVSRRTVFRYLNRLGDAGYVLVYDPDLGGHRLLSNPGGKRRRRSES
jgi:predicted DNA-binding transcriptional regulator YafY